jgi:hypothetical protein
VITDQSKKKGVFLSKKGLKRESKIFEDGIEDKGLTKETMN